MNTNTIPFEDFDSESQDFFQGMKFLDLDTIGFEGRQNGVSKLLTSVPKNKDFEDVSLFKNSKSGQYWNINIHQWAKPYYGSAKILDKKNIVIADKTSKVSHNQADFYNSLMQKETAKYNFVVYCDSDGENILKWYNDPEKVPNPDKPYEVLVFIETDDGKFDFGKIVRVKFGTAVLEDLKNKYFEELPSEDIDPEDIAAEFIKKAWAISVSAQSRKRVDKEIDSDDFKDLLIKSIEYEYNNKEFDDFSWFIAFLKGSQIIGVNLPDWCFSLGHWFRERRYIEDKYWNGDLPEKEFTPAFLPNFFFYDKEEDRSNYLKEMFNQIYNRLIEDVNEKLSGEDYLSKEIRVMVLDKILTCKEISDSFIDQILSSINIPDGYFQVYVKHFHAFILGLYNGLLVFIAGICDLMAILILICRNELGYRMSDLLTERFENFVDDLYYKTLETIKKIGYEMAKIFKDLHKWWQQFKEYDGKSYKIVKEIGEILPDIITFVIPFLKGSKVAKLAQTAEGIGEVAEKEVAEKVAKELTEAEAEKIAKSAKEALEKGTAAEATKEALEKVENEIVEKTPTQLDEVVVESSKKKKKRKTTKEEPKIFKKTQDLSIVLSNYADDALRLFPDETIRPGAASILEGEIAGRVYQAKSYSSRAKAVPKNKLIGRRHKLVQEWLGDKKNRPGHGRCAEPSCVSEFLFKAEKELGISADKMTIAQAREIFSKAKIKTVRINNIHVNLVQGLPKKACRSCNPLLKHFNITEIK